jgi:hypothetical protein
MNLCDETKGKYARDYLAERQITFESLKKWQLGLAVNSPDDLIKAAKAKKVPMKLLEQAGLILGQNQDKFINRLMFTITDVTGRVIGFGGRPGAGPARDCLDGNGGRCGRLYRLHNGPSIRMRQCCRDVGDQFHGGARTHLTAVCEKGRFGVR